MDAYNIPQLCMPAVPRRAVRTVTTKRMISVQVFFFMVIEEPTLDSLKSKVDKLQANYDKISQECDALKQALLRQVFE